MRQRIFLIVGLFIIVNLLLLILGRLQSDIMDSVRSYVRGEGLYAKAQKDAVFYLQKYIRSGLTADYNNYQKSLLIPLGDRQARMQLQSLEPDMALVTEGFLQGLNQIEDIPGMIRFFVRFQDFPYMKDAILIWAEADGHILTLQALGEQIYIVKQNNDHQALAPLVKKVDDLNKVLTALEYRFSLILSEGARWVKNLLMWVSFIAIAMMLLLVLYISRRITLGIEHTEKELMISEARFKSLYLTDMLGIMEWHLDGRILDANDAFLDMVGYSKHDLVSGKVNWRDLTPEHGHARDEVALKEIAEKGYCAPFEKDFIHHDGVTKVPVYLGAALFEGEETRGICFIVDHTELKNAHTEMQLSATVFDASSDGILITDNKQKILAVNKAWCQLNGYSPNEVVGQPINILHAGRQPDAFQSEMWQLLNVVNCWQGDVTTCRKDGREIHVRIGMNVVRSRDKELSHIVITYTDISEHIALEDRLREMAHYDFLTGLANRSLFNDLLANAIQRAKRNKSIFAVLFVDLDNFKPVNDLYGHDVGDKLLTEIASRYQNIVRGNDIVARIGGDEFVVLLDDMHQASDASRVASMIIEVTNQEICIEGKSLHVGCSIGISLFPDDGDNSKSMLQSADAAMYAAKAHGRNDFVFKSSINPS